MNDKKPDKNIPKITYRNKNRRKPVPALISTQRTNDKNKLGLLSFTMQLLYKNLYLLGITLLRKKLRITRKVKKSFARARGRAYALREKTGDRIVRMWRGIIRRIKAPFLRLGNVRAQMAPIIEQSRKDGNIPLRAYAKIVFTFFRLVITILRTLFNYAMPVLAAVYLFGVVNGQLKKTLSLEVTYNGQSIGLIENEAEFESAVRILKDRFISDDAGFAISAPKFELREVNPSEKYVTPKELANRIVRMSGDNFVDGFGLYIDDVFYGAVTESEPFFAELDTILAKNSSGEEDEEVEFVKKIKFEDGLYPLDSIVEQRVLNSVVNSYETVDEVYIVEYGDSPALIAAKTGVSVALLSTLNEGFEENLEPGQELLLVQARPFMPVKNIYTTVYDEEFPYEVEEIETQTYVRGYRETSVGGQPGIRRVRASISEVNGIEIERNILETHIIKEPVTEKIIVGTNDPRNIVSKPASDSGVSVSSAGFLWPTIGGSINVGLNGYRGHTGVDIPRDRGTPIVASAAGTVVVAKNTYTGYGRYLIIDHHNGYTTLYAHASALHVSVGQNVNQGDVIASVGSTGNATGSHLHFEVRFNSQILNPRNYIG